MALVDVHGRRAVRKIEKTRWSPVDLVCEMPDDGETSVLRTKLVRNPDTAAVCVSEAVSIAVFRTLGFMVADPFSVNVSAEFAESLSAQFEFDPPVIGGCHWGTTLITDAFEGEITAEHVQQLHDPEEAFLLYVADELLAHRDRAKDGRSRHGNTLLRADNAGCLRLLPIDHSDCFGHPSMICAQGGLNDSKPTSFANVLPGVEAVLLDRGPGAVDRAFERVTGAREAILSSVTEPRDQWYDIAGTEQSVLEDFLQYRLAHLDELARRAHWSGIAAMGGEEYALL